MTSVITFIGLNGSGKSTAADITAQILCKQGFSVDIRPLARALKIIAQKYFDITKDENRFKLEEFAEELKFQFGTQIFVQNAVRNTSGLDFIIIPDLRFREELDYLTGTFENVFVIEIDRSPETTMDDITRFNEIRGLSESIIIGRIGSDRTRLMTELYGLVSRIVTRKTDR